MVLNNANLIKRCPECIAVEVDACTTVLIVCDIRPKRGIQENEVEW